MNNDQWNTKTISTWNPTTLPVKFDKLDSWESFLGRWKRLKLEADAISYMHELINLSDRDDQFGNSLIPLTALLNFFLFYSQHSKNVVVKEKAQQLLASKILPRIGYSRYNRPYRLDEKEFVDLLRQIFQLLNSRLVGIRDRPYPGYVLKFLLEFQKLWVYEDYDNPKYDHKLRILSEELTHEFVTAMLVWSGGHYLYVFRKEDGLERLKGLERIIHGFLVDNNWLKNMCLEYIPFVSSLDSDNVKDHRVCMPFSVDFDIRDLKEKQLASAGAYLALLRVQDRIKHFGGELTC